MSKPFNKNDIPLPLIPKEPDEEDEKRKYSTFKLNTIVGDATSPKIGIAIKHVDGMEDLRDVLIFDEEINSLFARLGFTQQNQGPSADAIVRQLTNGSARETYNAIKTTLINDEMATLQDAARADGEAAGETAAQIQARINAVGVPAVTMDIVRNAIQAIITFVTEF